MKQAKTRKDPRTAAKRRRQEQRFERFAAELPRIANAAAAAGASLRAFSAAMSATGILFAAALQPLFREVIAARIALRGWTRDDPT
jgi:hypothetical protein